MHTVSCVYRAFSVRACIVSISAASIAFLARAQVSPSSTSTLGDSEDEAVSLSPFVVSADEDTGYGARDTLAGTRIRTRLEDVGSSISVITKQFLEDTNSASIEQLLVYTANTEVSAEGGNFLGMGDGAILTEVPSTTTRVRGTTSADRTRDFYLTDIPFDSYNTGRIDIQRGPNSILFGIGSPGGIVNNSLNIAGFKDSNRVSYQFASFGSQRMTADFNKVLLKNELAVRLSLLNDEKKYRQDPAYRDDRRVYLATKWDPAFLNKGSARTSLRASFEKGKIDSNIPRQTPPLDMVSPWFNPSQLNFLTYNPRTAPSATVTGPYFQSVGGNSGNAAAIAYNEKGEYLHSWYHMQGIAGAGNYRQTAVASYDKIANAQGEAGGFPWVSLGAYKATSLTDRSFFDFYENLLEGPNKWEFRDFKAFDAALSQTFLNDKVGFELSYNKEHAYFGGTQLFSSSTYALTVDMMTELPYGLPNPNVGRTMLVSSPGNSRWTRSDRENIRATAFVDINFADIAGKDSLLAKVLGRNTFTGMASRMEVDQFLGRYNNLYAAPNFARELHARPSFSGAVYFWGYMGPSLIGRTSMSGANITGMKGQMVPLPNMTYTAYNTATTQLDVIPFEVVYNLNVPDEQKLYQNTSSNNDRTWEQIDSTAAVWQGYWFGGTVVPMVGIRRDEQYVGDGGNPPNDVIPNARMASRNIYHPLFRAPHSAAQAAQYNAESGAAFNNSGFGSFFQESKVSSKTYSLVLHTPQGISRKLPGQTRFSLVANRSENVRPQASRRGLYGDPIPNPAGSTKEYGLIVSTLEERLSLRLTRYETKVTNVTLSGGLGANFHRVGEIEAQAQVAAMQQRDHAGAENHNFANPVYGVASNGFTVTWAPDGPILDDFADYTQAQIDATGAKQQAAIADWFANQLDSRFLQAWGFSDYDQLDELNPDDASFVNVSGISATVDTRSRGYEAEITARPVRGWDISFNLSKTFSTRTNLAPEVAAHLNARWEVFQGPAGDIRIIGGDRDDRASPNGQAHGGAGQTVRGRYLRDVMVNYLQYKASEGTQVPEARPWSANVITNYRFQEGKLNGWRVGGAYRWAAPTIIGYLGIQLPDGTSSFDAANPVKGPSQKQLDLWVGYGRKLTENIRWRAQLNVRNVLANDDLIPVTVQPDGGPAAYRIPEPRTFALTNTFEF